MNTGLAYLLLILIPILILGFSAFANAFKVGLMLSWISFASIMSYMIVENILPSWILILIILIFTIIFTIMFRNMLGGE